MLLRKALWSALIAGLSALAAMATKRVATKIWQIATGEEPPVHR
jgi:hypothetical protein